MKVSNEIIKALKLDNCTKQSLTALYNFLELNNGVNEQDIKKSINSKHLIDKKFNFGIGEIEFSSPIKFTKIENKTTDNFVYFDFDFIDRFKASTTLSYLKISSWCFKNSKMPFTIYVKKIEKYAFFGTQEAAAIKRIEKDLKSLGIDLDVKVPKRKTKIELTVKNNSKVIVKKEVLAEVENDWYDQLQQQMNKNNSRQIQDGWEE